MLGQAEYLGHHSCQIAFAAQVQQLVRQLVHLSRQSVRSDRLASSCHWRHSLARQVLQPRIHSHQQHLAPALHQHTHNCSCLCRRCTFWSVASIGVLSCWIKYSASFPRRPANALHNAP